MKSGGSVWFGVDSKSFEISLESPKGKLSGVITVRGVEACCQKEGLKVFNNSWLEGGEVTSFSYVAMRRAGDDPKPQHGSVQKDLPLKVDNVSKDWRSVSESIWLQFGGVDAFNKMHILNRCLVGQWGDFSNDALLLSSLKEWARRQRGVLQEGERIYKQKFLFLDRWAPTTGCFKGVKAKSAWWGTSVSPDEWERGSGEVAGGGRRLCLLCTCGGAPALGCYGELSIAKCQALQEEWLRQPFMRKRLRLEQQPSVGVAWKEGNLPPIAVSFPHGLEKGDGKLTHLTSPLAQKSFRVPFKALASWAPPCGIDLCSKEGEWLSRSSMFLVGALTPIDEALVEEATSFQGTRNLFSSTLGWGPLSSTPSSHALRVWSMKPDVIWG
ncbi:hypothetical protein CK203_058259 [Vitis vinifera]|uniref:DUF4283 domain-containing protein n=1 Tax=Vitis vinifera TaxID=29760 RepID=A0A438FTQ4_VITVI|nr:hypothetical protein CK203_058259 [Vitis vinifera]